MGRFDVLSRLIGGLAALAGVVAATFYARAGVSLSHYDARAHLVVARRIVEADPGMPRHIQTVWGLGYVFIPEPDPVSRPR